MRRGATPAVLRLYDAPESQRGQGGDGVICALLVLDEGDVASVNASMSIVEEECLATIGCIPRDVDAVEKWMHHRNDTSALQALTKKVSLSTRWKLRHRGPHCRQSLTQLDKPCWPCRTPAQQPVIYPTVTSMARVCILLSPPLRHQMRLSPPTSRCGMLAHVVFSLTGKPQPSSRCRTQSRAFRP